MADWGTPPGMIDNEPRSDSPANDMRMAKLERRRRILEEQEKKKRRHQLGKIERNEVSSARRRDGKTPLVNNSGSDGPENHSRYAYDNPEAYNDSTDINATSVKVVNVAQSPDTLDDSDESLSDHDNAVSSIPVMSNSQTSSSSRQTTPPKAPSPQQQPQPTQEKKKREKRKSKKPERQPSPTPVQQEQPVIEEQRARAFGSDDEDDLDSSVIPDSNQVRSNRS